MIRLLIADDHAIVRGGLKQMFALSGDLQVVGEATNGPEVLACLRGEPFDLLLLDINMPGISGFEAAELIQRSHPQVRIAILTANIQSASRDKAQQLRVKFVQKPATQAAIQQAIDYFLAAP